MHVLGLAREFILKRLLRLYICICVRLSAAPRPPPRRPLRDVRRGAAVRSSELAAELITGSQHARGRDKHRRVQRGVAAVGAGGQRVHLPHESWVMT